MPPGGPLADQVGRGEGVADQGGRAQEPSHIAEQSYNLQLADSSCGAPKALVLTAPPTLGGQRQAAPEPWADWIGEDDLVVEAPCTAEDTEVAWINAAPRQILQALAITEQTATTVTDCLQLFDIHGEPPRSSGAADGATDDSRADGGSNAQSTMQQLYDKIDESPWDSAAIDHLQLHQAPGEVLADYLQLRQDGHTPNTVSYTHLTLPTKA